MSVPEPPSNTPASSTTPSGATASIAAEPRYARFEAIELRGAEAAKFLHAQLATDVEHAADGSAHWSSYLTAQGRVIAVVRLVRRAFDAVDLYVPAERGAELLVRLQRFVFRAKVKLAVRSAHYEARVEPGQDESSAVSNVAARGDSDSGTLNVASDDEPIELGSGAALVRIAADAPADPAVEARFRAWLVQQAIPLVAGATIETQTPHALGLDALDAVSTRKGCYPGQEIVARTHFLGRNKRHLVRYAADAGSEIAGNATLARDDGNPAATSLFSTRDRYGRLRGLAVAHEQALQDARWHAPDGTPVVPERIR